MNAFKSTRSSTRDDEPIITSSGEESVDGHQHDRPVSDYDLYIFDMDGVIYRMDDPIPGARETIQFLYDQGKKIAFLTNNSSQTRADYVRKLSRFQIKADEPQIMTSAYATGQLLKQWGLAGRSAYIIGEAGLRDELEMVGIRILEQNADIPDYVVVGWDRDFHYRKLAWAHQCIQQGARFIATNRDATYPDAGGHTLPGGGTMVAALETCSGVKPLVVGKPSSYCFEMLFNQYAVDAARCLVIGDRVDTDVVGAHRSGCPAALVLTGVTHAEELAEMDLASRPEYVLSSIHTLRAHRMSRQASSGS